MDSGKLQLIMLDFWRIKHKGLENFDSSSEIKKEISTKLAKQTTDQRNTKKRDYLCWLSGSIKIPPFQKILSRLFQIIMPSRALKQIINISLVYRKPS